MELADLNPCSKKTKKLFFGHRPIPGLTGSWGLLTSSGWPTAIARRPESSTSTRLRSAASPTTTTLSSSATEVPLILLIVSANYGLSRLGLSLRELMKLTEIWFGLRRVHLNRNDLKWHQVGRLPLSIWLKHTAFVTAPLVAKIDNKDVLAGIGMFTSPMPGDPILPGWWTQHWWWHLMSWIWAIVVWLNIN